MNKMIFLIMMFFVLIVSPANAGNILFVSDSTTDTNIPTVLTGEGHSVTVVTNDYPAHAALLGNLNSYCAVYWSATKDNGPNPTNNPPVFVNLTNYISGGGHVFITGADSIASPPDTEIISLLGGTSSADSGNPLSVINSANSLTTGVVDIRGVTPTGYYSDQDTVCGPLAVGAIGVVPSSYTGCTGYSWTLRTIGNGEVAYVSNGDFMNDPNTPSWADTSAGGAGAYNAALRNFAYNACSSTAVPTMTEWGMIFFVGLAGLGSIYYLRKQKTVKS